MSAQEVGSIIWTALSGSIKLIARAYASMLRAQGQVKHGKKLLKEQLVKQGIPKDFAEEIADVYASAAEQFLSIRKLIGLARDSSIWNEASSKTRNPPVWLLNN
ncbi:MAG: hypothetical protein JSW61_06340 [Candidatus Thorarchaeota archaeon]|nr:MAG: hypothetical protein JSW61_06340 [Candidatus Thorarchaeota archaeon]